MAGRSVICIGICMKELEGEVRHKKLFLLDIDGTIAFDSTLIDGTLKFMNRVLELGGKYIFITNNSTKSIKDYITKFEKFKISVDESSFLTSSYVTALYLRDKYKDQLIFSLGTKSFIEELKSYGVKVTEELEPEIKAAVVGFDNELNYKKLEKICELLQTRKIDYVATNPDLACPTNFGFIPDCGAICKMIESAVGREPIYIGKPNPLIVEVALKNNFYTKEETVVIGDRLYTDIACGINGDVDTIAVFTGEVKKEDLYNTPYPPKYFCNSIQDIYLSLLK